MRKTCVSSTLIVYFDGQFWVGMAERIEDGRLSACRIVFGAEPSNEDVLAFVLERWAGLPFGATVEADAPKVAGNRDRRQRQAARELKQRGASTKAQQALAEEREAAAALRASEARGRRERAHAEAYQQRKLKAKKRHRGK